MVHSSIKVPYQCTVCNEMEDTVALLNSLGNSLDVYATDESVSECKCEFLGSKPRCKMQIDVMEYVKAK